MRRIMLVVFTLCWLAAGARAWAQSDADYLRLVDAYAHGAIQESVAALAEWPESDIRAGVRAVIDRPGLNLKAAAMLQTEVAFATGGDRRSVFHLDAARTFVNRISGDGAPAFKARWHAWVVVLHVARADLASATREVQEGFSDDAKSGEVGLAAGVLSELAARNAESNLRGQWNMPPDSRARGGIATVWNGSPDGRARAGVATLLSDATLAYERSLTTDAGLLEARLRLGWVLLLNHGRPPARAQLQQVVDRATRPDLQYLAHLFMGALDEADKRMDDAVREYDAAYAIVPGQSAAVALMRLEGMLGQDERARQLAAELAARSDVARPDPWVLYNLGITSGALGEWLRSEGQQPR